MANPIADIERLKNAFERPLVEDDKLKEVTAATQWLDDAWGIVLDEIPGVEHRLTLPDGDPSRLRQDTVARVMVAAVIRVLRNPDARRQLGEDTYQETIDQAVSSGQLYITDTERRRILSGASSGAAPVLPTVFSVSVGG